MLKSRTHRTLAGTIAGVAALSLALTGCESAVNSPQNPSSEPVAGGTLTIAQSSDAQPNNVQSGRLGNFSWAANVFETLTLLDAEGEPQPLLATEWTLADDQMSIDITLRDDVTFHGGRPMTAEDVKFSFETAAASSSQTSYIGKMFTDIAVTSDDQLTITFSQPIPNLFDFFEQTFILDQETIAGLDDGSEVIGTGPFVFASWTPGSELSLERNDNYWGEEPYLDGIDVAVIPDSTAMLNAVRSGRSQIAIGMNPQDVNSISSSPGYNIQNTSGSVYPFGIDVTQAPFDTVEARQAVNYAIDRERIATQVFAGSATASDLFWDSASVDYPSDLEGYYDYDPDKARQLLEEAGAEGAAVTINVISIPANASVAEIVRNNLEEVGLTPTINAVDTQTFGQNQIAGDLGQSFMPLHGLNGLAPITLMNTLPSLREGNPSKFWTPEYQELRDDLLSADDADYGDALRALSEYMLEQAFSTNVVRVDGQFVVADGAQGLSWTSRAYLDATTGFVTP